MQKIMTSIKGLTLDTIEKKILSHPDIYGVILFSRNYQDKTQLQKLTTTIKQINPELQIAVDHEGGRVWRFRDSFELVPPMQTLGDLFLKDEKKAQDLAFKYGKTIASELKEVGVDFSFTPVLDINYNNSSIIGNRSFSDEPQIITTLAKSLIAGLHSEDMISVGKHFPGHGFVAADSHLELPIDNRTFDKIKQDINIFATLAQNLDAIMTAHILYPNFDNKVATFSKKWLDYLKNEINFKGLIFSDDLSMLGAKIIPNIKDRVKTAFAAGCDIVLICNDENATLEVLKEKL
jgi:beta-N-acetylhexosaminidase